MAVFAAALAYGLVVPVVLSPRVLAVQPSAKRPRPFPQTLFTALWLPASRRDVRPDVRDVED